MCIYNIYANRTYALCEKLVLPTQATRDRVLPKMADLKRTTPSLNWFYMAHRRSLLNVLCIVPVYRLRLGNIRWATLYLSPSIPATRTISRKEFAIQPRTGSFWLLCRARKRIFDMHEFQISYEDERALHHHRIGIESQIQQSVGLWHIIIHMYQRSESKMCYRTFFS